MCMLSKTITKKKTYKKVKTLKYLIDNDEVKKNRD